MDLTDPARLRDVIEKLASQSADAYGVALHPSAIDELVGPGEDHLDELRDVDLARLGESIGALFAAVPQTEPPSPVGAGSIRFAIARSRCHYLWFC